MEELEGIDDLSSLIFKGVLTKATVYLFVFSIRRAKARKGFIWPCAMKGNITIISFVCDIVELKIKEDKLMDERSIIS